MLKKHNEENQNMRKSLFSRRYFSRMRFSVGSAVVRKRRGANPQILAKKINKKIKKK